MTREEFVEYWIKNANENTPEDRRFIYENGVVKRDDAVLALRFKPRECDCGEEGCKGWKMDPVVGSFF